MNDKIERFFAERRPATPCLVLDLGVVEDNFKALSTALPDARIYYAVKANPAPFILKLLVRLGSSFDCASVQEIDMVLAAGGSAFDISYGNTIKKQTDIARAFARGVRLYAFDSIAELDKIALAAPGSRVFCRILTSGDGAEWPLSVKFGCSPAMAKDLLLLAADKGVVPFGVSFHVGSQQRDPGQWDKALATTARLFRELEAEGVELKMVNLGGGFPTRYRRDVLSAEAYGRAILNALRTHFGNRIPETIVEPGRSMVGNAGVIESEVVLISKKGGDDDRRWVYLDIGKFSGLAETTDELIQYDIKSDRTGQSERVIIAGPSCDSVDVLYEKSDYRLPLDLCIGDHLRINGTGAYTTTYASIGFNGFPPLDEHYI
ncbi:MAG: type III PLP-dependent enzyme [Rhodospirillaceae bacterium]